jgi:hypothetical protein
MIAPQWDAFPGSIKLGFTSFYVRFSSRYNKQELMDELTSFYPTLLTFLCKLNRVELEVNRTVWSDCLRRTESRSASSIDLCREGSSKEFVAKARIATSLPPDSRKVRCSESKIVLAFLTYDLGNEPPMDAQKAYAFLSNQ